MAPMSMPMPSGPVSIHINPGLVALSVFVAVLAGYIALDLVQRSTTVHARARRVLIGAGGVTMGLGIWSMHFIGMLSWDMGTPESYEPVLVVLSMLAAILGSGGALALVARARARALDLFAAATFMALAIAAMHYLGMASMEMEATIHWNLALVVLSILIGFAASLFALWLVMMIGRERLHLAAPVRLAAATVLGFGVAGLHYTGMAAASFHMAARAGESIAGSSIDSGWIVVPLVLGAAILLTILIAGAAFDQRRAALADDLMQVAGLARDLSHNEDARGRACAGIAELTGAAFAALLEQGEDGRLAVTATAGVLPRRSADEAAAARRRNAADLAADPALAALAADPALAALAETPGRHFSADLAGMPAADLGFDAILGQTLVRDGRPVGVLVLTWQERSHDLDERTRSLLEMVVAEAAIAIDREDLIARLDFMARRDPLTGLANRRTLQHELDRALARAAADGAPLSLVMLDLDKFKQHNDRHGHQAGDRLLKTAAAAWTELLREGDTLARYGGDEFIAILPGTRFAAAFSLAERLRGAVPGDATTSVGVAEWDGSQSGPRLISAADRSLYDAKRAGRDQSFGLEVP
jgi:diguanylate cyclase (GGDEF)-like protein